MGAVFVVASLAALVQDGAFQTVGDAVKPIGSCKTNVTGKSIGFHHFLLFVSNHTGVYGCGVDHAVQIAHGHGDAQFPPVARGELPAGPVCDGRRDGLFQLKSPQVVMHGIRKMAAPSAVQPAPCLQDFRADFPSG